MRDQERETIEDTTIKEGERQNLDSYPIDRDKQNIGSYPINK